MAVYLNLLKWMIRSFSQGFVMNFATRFHDLIRRLPHLIGMAAFFIRLVFHQNTLRLALSELKVFIKIVYLMTSVIHIDFQGFTPPVKNAYNCLDRAVKPNSWLIKCRSRRNYMSQIMQAHAHQWHYKTFPYLLT